MYAKETICIQSGWKPKNGDEDDDVQAVYHNWEEE